MSFCSGSTRSAAHFKLQLSPANRSTNRIRHFYFSRLPHLWNYLLTTNLEKSVMSIKSDVTAFFWSRFQQTFDPSRPCTYHAVCPCAWCSSLSLPNNFNQAVSTNYIADPQCRTLLFYFASLLSHSYPCIVYKAIINNNNVLSK